MSSEKPAGKTRDTGFQVGVRKTVRGNTLYTWDFLFSEKGLGIWLGNIDPDDLVIRRKFSLSNQVTGKITVFEPYSYLTMDWKKNGWDNASQLQVRVTGSGEDSTVVSFLQEMLAGPEQREEMKAHWEEILSFIEDAIGTGYR